MATDAAGDAIEGCPRCGLLDELEGDAAALAPQGRPIPMDRDQVEVEVEHRLAAGPPVQAQDVHRRLFPQGIWEHDKVDDNGAAHLKAMILGPSETVPIRGGRLLLGTWQGIALVGCDGSREREIVVDIR
jgi:hypothetical protein